MTEEILKKIIERCGQKTDLLIFPLSCGGESYEKIKMISAKLGIKLIASEVNELLNTADSGKNLMRAADGSHLNEDGEKIVGEWLAEWYLKNNPK